MTNYHIVLAITASGKSTFVRRVHDRLPFVFDGDDIISQSNGWPSHNDSDWTGRPHVPWWAAPEATKFHSTHVRLLNSFGAMMEHPIVFWCSSADVVHDLASADVCVVMPHWRAHRRRVAHRNLDVTLGVGGHDTTLKWSLIRHARAKLLRAARRYGWLCYDTFDDALHDIIALRTAREAKPEVSHG